MTSSAVAVLDAATDACALGRALDGYEEIYSVSTLADLTVQQRAALAALVMRSGCRLDSETITTLPALRHVVRPGSGTDNIDASGLAAWGIRLHRNPHASADAVAEWILAATIALLRRVPLGHNGLLEGKHLKAECASTGLMDRPVAIWGGGPVGRAAYRVLRDTAKVQFAAWPSLDPELLNAAPEQPLTQADVHVLALPLRPSTRGFVDRSFLNQMRRHAVVVCAGRFGTIDLPACIEALRDGQITGLAIDALDVEHVATVRAAASRHPLNLLVTPHIGAQRDDVRAQPDAWVRQVLRCELRGEDD